jgi:hypothetical protein
MIMPTIKQFLANFGSSCLKAKCAIKPPIILKHIGTRYHAFDLILGSLIINRIIV